MKSLDVLRAHRKLADKETKLYQRFNEDLGIMLSNIVDFSEDTIEAINDTTIKVWESEEERQEWFAKNSPPKPDPTIIPGHDCDFGAFDFIGQAILSFIDWLNRLFQSEEIVLLVQAEKGVQVKDWHDRLFFVRSIVDFDENGNPILAPPPGGTLVVSRFDSNGDIFVPDGPFEIRNKKGKVRGISYEWQPIAPKPKRKANSEQMATLGELFEGYEETLPPPSIPSDIRQ